MNCLCTIREQLGLLPELTFSHQYIVLYRISGILAARLSGRRPALRGRQAGEPRVASLSVGIFIPYGWVSNGLQQP